MKFIPLYRQCAVHMCDILVYRIHFPYLGRNENFNNTKYTEYISKHKWSILWSKWGRIIWRVRRKCRLAANEQPALREYSYARVQIHILLQWLNNDNNDEWWMWEEWALLHSKQFNVFHFYCHHRPLLLIIIIIVCAKKNEIEKLPKIFSIRTRKKNWRKKKKTIKKSEKMKQT